jgi:hypothetical protein
VNEPPLGLDALSRLLSTQRDFGTEAEQIHRDLVELKPLDISAKNRLAQCLVARGARAEAAAVCESVLEIDPENSIARARRDDLRRPHAPIAPTPPRPPGPKPTPRAPNRVGGIDRASESAAAAVIQGLYPAQAERQQCLARLAMSIKLLHHLSPEYWEITLEQRLVTLNVSKLAAICFLPGKLRLLAEKAWVPPDIWNLSLSVGGVPQAGLRTALNLEWIDLPSSRLDELLPRCQRAHEEAVLQASLGGRSTHPQAHSPGVVAFMNTTLDEHIIGR